MEIFKNSEWVATDKGIEGVAKNGKYWTDIDEVCRESSRNEIRYYDLPIHLAEKEWVAMPLFFEAFVHALRYAARQSGRPVDEPMLASTYRKAIEIALLTQQCEVDRLRDARDGGRIKVMRLNDYASSPELKRYEQCKESLKRLKLVGGEKF